MVFLEFRFNACPVCLICLDCQKKYGQDCTCQARAVEWKRKKVERDYTVDFCHKPFTKKGATHQKVMLDSEFVSWFIANISLCIEISTLQNNVNVCQNCMSGYRHEKNKGMLSYIITIVLYL